MPRTTRTSRVRSARGAVLVAGALVAASLSFSASPALAVGPAPALVLSAPLGPISNAMIEGTPVVDSTTHTMFAMATKLSGDVYQGDELLEIDDLTGQVVGSLTPARGTNIAFGYLALDEGTHTLYYASGQTIQAFDTASGAQTGSTQLATTGTIHGIAVDSATHDVLVASDTAMTSTLYEFSGDLGTVLAQAALPQPIGSLAVDSVTRKAFVSEYWTAMAEVDLPTFAVGTTTTATQVDSLAVDESTGQLFGRQLVGVNEVLTVFSETTLAVTATPVPAVSTFKVDPVRGFVYVADSYRTTMSEVDTSTDTVTRTVSTPSPNQFNLDAVDRGTGSLFDTGSHVGTGFISVLAAPSSITSAAPPAGATWIDYSFTPTMSPAGVYWSAYGTLPPGLSLDASTGTISGTPTTAGTFTYTLTGRDAHGDGASATYSQTIQLNRLVYQVSGPDRYQTSVAVAQQAFPDGAPIVFVASGTNFPDALSAAPAATKLGGPVLLTAPGSLPASVAAEIADLQPAKVVVVGGVNSVSAAVQSQLAALVPNTVRWSGADRFATSRVIDQNVWGNAFIGAYVATGRNFPDALAAGAVAGALGAPLILVDGGAGALDQGTLDYFGSQENAYGITIAGGVNAVSAGIELDLRNLGPNSLVRFAGADRYQTAMLLNEDAWNVAGANPTEPTSNLAFLVTGSNFPDALAAGPWAGGTDAPMFLVTGTCVPNGVIDDLNGLGVDQVVLVGGPSVLTAPVAELTPCDLSAASAIAGAKAQSPRAAPQRLDVASHPRRAAG